MVTYRVSHLDAHHLHIFYVVVVENNLSSAAEKLHLSQPNITYHIKCLEEYVQAKLITFKKQKVNLTPVGEVIFQYASDIHQQLINVEKVKDLIKGSSLRVGIGPGYVPVITPLLETLVGDQNREFKLFVKVGNAFEMIEDLLDSRLDLVVVQYYEYESTLLRYITVSLPERMVCFASPKHPLGDKELVDWKDLAEYVIVTGSETAVIRKMIGDKFTQEEINKIPEVGAEVNSTELCKKLVENSNNISFCFFRDVEKEVDEGKLRILPLRKDIYVVAAAILRNDTYMHPVITDFISAIKQAFNFKD